MMEAQIQDLQSQLNSMKTEQQSENDLDGNENQTKEIDSSSDSPDTSNLEDGEVVLIYG